MLGWCVSDHDGDSVTYNCKTGHTSIKLFLIIDMFSLGGMVFWDMYSPVVLIIYSDIFQRFEDKMSF